VLLNFAWEMFAAGFYDAATAAMHADGAAIACVRAAFGDGVITLAAFTAAAAVATPRWLVRPSVLTMAIYLGAGIGITVVFEYVSVYRLHRWGYGPSMPIVAGIGALPLLQWLVLPPIILWLARRYLAVVQPIS
jgi:hypothetical protein